MRGLFLLPIGLALLLGGVLRAGPLDKSHVPAEARWLIHLDLQQLHANPTVVFLRGKLLEREDVRQTLTTLDKELGFDPIKGLRGMTLFGYNHIEGEGAVLVDATADVKKAEAKVAKQQAHRTFQHGDHRLHAWVTAPGRKADGTAQKPKPVVWAVHPNGLHVYASNEAIARKVLDLLDGKSTTLEKATDGLQAKLPDRCILYIEAVGLDKSKRKQQFEADSVILSVHQDDQQLHLRAGMVARKAEEAQRAQKWLQGLRLILEAQLGGEEPDAEKVKKVLNRIRIALDDRTLSVSFGLRHSVVTEQIKQWLAQRRKAREAADPGNVQ